ncbi:Arc family DNA-binding protein [Kluyvera ascorbata]|jgi:hypothetical protein|uniref:Arc family DNA-binding protein n=1 Tax=Kluyvera ascorbata TaxID=51288 RepID=UPI002806384B|nr:Arc family DNA-binding protein [Kluyvera ascorbata]MDU3913788.1 Arc family DNA-binding protein [Kluyvera ascorbata]
MSRPYKNPQVNLRLPEDLKQKIAALAESNGRSANAEMVAALESWVEMHDIPEERELTFAELALSIKKLQQQLDILAEGAQVATDEPQNHLPPTIDRALLKK